MKVEFVLLAEAINKSATGTLNMLGEFNTIFSDEFPFVRSGFALMIRLRGDEDERGSYRVRARLAKQGSDVSLAEFESTASRQLDRLDEPIHGDIIVNAHGLVFPEPGQYELEVFIDETLAYTRALSVSQSPSSGR